MSVGGSAGTRSEVWRSLAWELGDRWADLVCAWADYQADPTEVVASLLSAVALRPPEEKAGTAAFNFVSGVDWPTWQAVVDALDDPEGYLP